MIPFDSLILFLTASTLLSIAPGPDNIFVLTQAAQYGGKSGIFVTLGLCTGLLVHTSAVSVGIAAVFQSSVYAFALLKITGACYLLYLAYRAFSASVTTLDNNTAEKLSSSQLYGRGVIMNITNPKVLIFFLAFLPQFTVPENGSVAVQIFLLGLLFAVIAFIIFSAISVLSGSLGSWLVQSPKAQIYLNRIAGVVFVCLAIMLIVPEGALG